MITASWETLTTKTLTRQFQEVEPTDIISAIKEALKDLLLKYYFRIIGLNMIKEVRKGHN